MKHKNIQNYIYVSKCDQLKSKMFITCALCHNTYSKNISVRTLFGYNIDLSNNATATCEKSFEKLNKKKVSNCRIQMETVETSSYGLSLAFYCYPGLTATVLCRKSQSYNL